MRSKIEYQTGLLSEVIFHPGLSKALQKQTGELANTRTIQTYREIWNQLGNYVKDNYGIKDLQKLTPEYIMGFMMKKVFQGVSEQYLETISCAIGKLEHALTMLHEKFIEEQQRYATNTHYVYDFSIRQTILNDARKHKLVIETSADPNFSRIYENPKALINAIEDPLYKLAAKIQYESGARLEGVLRIDEYMRVQTHKLKDNTLSDTIEYARVDDTYSSVPQLQGYEYDTYEAMQKGRIFDVEKGGKPGNLSVKVETYQELKAYLIQHSKFIINKNKYRLALKKAANQTGQKYDATHGLRWNYAQERFFKIQVIGGLSYVQALQEVSWAMKHERANISEHYLG
ncbi:MULTISPECIES: hypothetical protein [Sulfurospirillum]|uniref:Core-binding (CB) domain-containing protein n=4 Tax=Sulfurospirillum TaxID=57665 RepID=A0A1Y0HN72_9BACT|nr:MULTISPECIES: hypothetical protein [Sulfurospirillum]AHJ12847.1 hypothetical protein SMUL_1587 [Sulfurospirillum multivorans DSM 12446]AOO65323.1 hypothetical protein SHALO_1548 [Sulfurospirillum halorespirans DSM 13726]ARU48804.1 hypothetical protein Sdiek1_1641 [Sulfurospirillum diekertiae]ASC93625.1 hypothetical protein Sdiek2_1607 [Sulfurospirillum diekertiae]ATB69669.1 hypothetical protein SJPD1_1560 [Sulfurospirillum diekertiae]